MWQNHHYYCHLKPTNKIFLYLLPNNHQTTSIWKASLFFLPKLFTTTEFYPILFFINIMFAYLSQKKDHIKTPTSKNSSLVVKGGNFLLPVKISIKSFLMSKSEVKSLISLVSGGSSVNILLLFIHAVPNASSSLVAPRIVKFCEKKNTK